jgi:hypothetical protein
MKSLSFFKKMSVFSKRSFLPIVVAIFTQTMIACKSDEIAPQSLSEQAQILVKENNLRRVTTLPQSEPIIYLKSVEKASQFFLGLKSKLKSQPNNAQVKTQWTGPHSYNGMTAIGVFTFPNNVDAEMYFDVNGNISSMNINGDSDVSVNYDSQNGYVEATKWGIIAIPIPMGDGGKNFLNSYEYYYAPITRWSAYLESGWSSIRYFNTEANLEVEGFGSFYIRYSSAETTPKPTPGNYGTSGEIIPIPKR